MSNARQNILRRLRSNAVSQPEVAPDRILERHDWSREEKIERFCQAMESVRTEIYQVSDADWTDKLQEVLKQKRLKTLLYAPQGPLAKRIEQGWQDKQGLPELITREGVIESFRQELFNEIEVAITSTRSGIAEVGAMILWPTPEEPRTFSLVPPVHIAVVEADKLHNTFADAIENEGWADGMPTNALLISGPSKSADIEQTLAYGVHGPMELVVLLIT